MPHPPDILPRWIRPEPSLSLPTELNSPTAWSVLPWIIESFHLGSPTTWMISGCKS